MRGKRPGMPGNRLPPGAGVNQKVAHPASGGVRQKISTSSSITHLTS